jgi:hypothetical protein
LFAKPSLSIFIKNLWVTDIFERAIAAFTGAVSGFWRLPTFYNMPTVINSI